MLTASRVRLKNWQIFTHLVFYVDTSANAERNGLKTSSPADEVTER